MIVVLGKGKSRNGSGKGVRDYYLYGTNNDRDKKDSRVVLHGNLNTLSKTIDLAHQLNYKETYRNIVLSFSEDYIKQETLENIVEDFKRQYMAGYGEDEYVFYAEAHLPKIKNKQDPDTHKVVYRKPHIHISVATYSPKLDKILSLGNHGQRLQELEIWKSITEKTYGLKLAQNSPLKKDVTQVHDTKLLSRKEVVELCNKVIEDNIQDKILDSHKLKIILLENIEGIEEIRESTSKAKTPYFAIKMKNVDKVIRLKGNLFSSDHLVFSEAREQLLNKYLDNTYCEVRSVRKIPSRLQEKLSTYYKSRCEYVAKREAVAREKVDALQGTMVDIEGIKNLPIAQKKEGIPTTSLVQSKIQDIQQSIDIKTTTTHYQIYKKTLYPQYVFDLLDVDKNRYIIHKIKDEYRIGCGKRNLNIHDFLTKEVHLSWAESKDIMDIAYQQQSIKESQELSKLTNSFTCYQAKIFYRVYKSKLQYDLKSYYVKVDNDIVHIVSKENNVNITDYGNKIVATGQNTQEQVKLMIEISIAKGWDLSTIEIDGSEEFKKEVYKQIEAKESTFYDELDIFSKNLKELNNKLSLLANPKQTSVDIEKPMNEQQPKINKSRKNYR